MPSKTVKPYDRPKSILNRFTDFLLPQPSWLGNLLQSHPEEKSESQQDQTRPINLESFIFQRPPDSIEDQVKVPTNISADWIPVLTIADGGVHLRDDSIKVNDGESSHKNLLPMTERETNHFPIKSLKEKGLCKILTLSKSTMTDASIITKAADIKRDGEYVPTLGKNDLLEIHLSNTCDVLPRPQPSGFISSKPKFNHTLFSQPVSTSKSRKFSMDRSITDSPFYSGRTTYGGASAYCRILKPTIVSPNVEKQRVPLLSSSSNRIFNILESTSTSINRGDTKRLNLLQNANSAGLSSSRHRPNLGLSTTTMSTSAIAETYPSPDRAIPGAPKASSTPIINQQTSSDKVARRKSVHWDDTTN